MVDAITTLLVSTSKAKGALLQKKWKSLRPEIDKHINFVDKGLLKGMLSSALLSKGGKHLKSHISDNTTNINHLAFTVDHNDAFISHNWSTPGNDKYLVLCLHLHTGPALCVVLAFKMLYSVLVVFGVLPCIRISHIGGEELVSAPGVGLLASPLFIFIVLTWGDVAYYLGLPAPTVFFDKACISQTDQNKQRQGILSLAAFLNYSWSTVVIYTETYLARLWTVYEIASVLTLHPRGRLFVYPPILSKVCIVGSVAIFAFGALSLISRGIAASMVFAGEICFIFLGVVGVLEAIAVVWVARKWARERERAQAAVLKFKAADAGCFCEDDRSIVYSNIAVFMKHLKHVAADATLPEALNAFDNLVHDQVPVALQSFWGRAGIPYRYVLCLTMAFFSLCLEEFLGALHVLYVGPVDAVEHDSVRDTIFVLKMLDACILYLFHIPLSVGFLFMTLRYCQHLQGLPEMMFIIFATLLFLIFLLAAPACLQFLQAQSLSVEAHVSIVVAFSICLCMATVWMYRRPRMTSHRRRFVEAVQDQFATTAFRGSAQPASQSVGIGNATVMDGYNALAGEAASGPAATVDVDVEANVAHASEVAWAVTKSTDPLFSTSGWQDPVANVDVEANLAHASEVACDSQLGEATCGSFGIVVRSVDTSLRASGWKDSRTTTSASAKSSQNNSAKLSSPSPKRQVSKSRQGVRGGSGSKKVALSKKAPKKSKCGNGDESISSKSAPKKSKCGNGDESISSKSKSSRSVGKTAEGTGEPRACKSGELRASKYIE